MSETRSDTLQLRKSFESADFFGRTALILSTWFCSGLVPKAPGTFGTITAIPLVVAVSFLGDLLGVLFLPLFILVAVWASESSQKLLGRDDPPEIVIDEVAGFLVTLALMPLTLPNVIGGFFLFRFFDILKPFPIGRLEKLRGGAGIVLDDLLAGVYANVLLRLVSFLYAG